MEHISSDVEIKLLYVRSLFIYKITPPPSLAVKSASQAAPIVEHLHTGQKVANYFSHWRQLKNSFFEMNEKLLQIEQLSEIESFYLNYKTDPNSFYENLILLNVTSLTHPSQRMVTFEF